MALNPTTQSWKTVRVFISSTFRDMQAERDHLVRFVFPRLRQDLLVHRIYLVDVDLRWGVTNDQDALEVCREVLDECRPRFLCMLGARYGWVPPSKTRSITADEIQYGVLNRTLKNHGFTYFYFRDDKTSVSMVENTPGEYRELRGSDTERKLSELKQSIITAGFNPFVYEAQWDNQNRRLTGFKKFGDRVYDDLLSGIKSDPIFHDYFETDIKTPSDEFVEEYAAMEAFVAERIERFVLGSRESVLNQLIAYTRSIGYNGYTCLTGVPGSGKSALLAFLSQHPSLNAQPSTILISHFVGASSGSTDVRRTLLRLCNELKMSCPYITNEIPNDLDELYIAFQNFLKQASEQQQIIIMIDAINQFDHSLNFGGLKWLPKELPEKVHFILSTIEGPELDGLRMFPKKIREIELKPFTRYDGEAIIEQFRQRYHKKLDKTQCTLLLNKKDAGLPLYLLTALEEMRTLGTYEEISQRIQELPQTIHGLFIWILERLGNDDGFRDSDGHQVGSKLVSHFAALLGASRYGLSQSELTDLLEPGDPQGNIAAQLHLLRPYMMHRGNLLDFYHSHFRAAAKEAWLKTDAQCQSAHAELAGYFRTKADPINDGSWREAVSRTIGELPYHQIEARDWSALDSTLCDIAFIEAKCRLGMISELLVDYEHARLDGVNIVPKIKDWHEFVLEASHILRTDPDQAFQLAANSTRNNPVEVAAQSRWEIGKEGRHWFRYVNKKSYSPTNRQTLKGHRNPITAIDVCHSNNSIVSGDEEGVIMLWDLTRSEPIDTWKVQRAVSDICFMEGNTNPGIFVICGETAFFIQKNVAVDHNPCIKIPTPVVGCLHISQHHVAIISEAGDVMIFDVDNWGTISRYNLGITKVTAATLTNDRTRLVLLTPSYEIQFREVSSGNIVSNLILPKKTSMYGDEFELDRGILAGPGNRVLLPARLMMHNQLNWHLIYESILFVVCEQKVECYIPCKQNQTVLAYTDCADNDHFAVATEDGKIELWTLAGGKMAYSLGETSTPAKCMCHMKEKDILVIGTVSGTIEIFDKKRLDGTDPIVPGESIQMVGRRTHRRTLDCTFLNGLEAFAHLDMLTGEDLSRLIHRDSPEECIIDVVEWPCPATSDSLLQVKQRLTNMRFGFRESYSNRRPRVISSLLGEIMLLGPEDEMGWHWFFPAHSGGGDLKDSELSYVCLLSPNGQSAYMTNNGNIVEFDFVNERILRSIDSNLSVVKSLEISGNGQILLALGERASKINVTTGECHYMECKYPNCGCLSLTGNIVCIGRWDGILRVSRDDNDYDLKVHNGEIIACILTPDQESVLTLGRDLVLAEVSIHQCKVVARYFLSSLPTCMAIAPGMPRICIGDDKGSITLLQLERKDIVFPHSVTWISEEGKLIATCPVCIWNHNVNDSQWFIDVINNGHTVTCPRGHQVVIDKSASLGNYSTPSYIY